MIINSIIAALAILGLVKSEWRPKLADTILFVDTLLVWGLLVVTPLMKYGPRVVNTPEYPYEPPASWVILMMVGILVLLLVGVYLQRRVIRDYVIRSSWFWIANTLVFIYLSIGALTGNFFNGLFDTSLTPKS